MSKSATWLKTGTSYPCGWAQKRAKLQVVLELQLQSLGDLQMSITPRPQDLPDAELVNHLMTHTDAGAILRSQCGDEVAQEFLAEVLQAIRKHDNN